MCARVDQLLILGMVIPPLKGNPSNRYINPYGIGLMTIPYQNETTGVDRPQHMYNPYNWPCICGCFRKLWVPQIIHFYRFSTINHPFWGTTIFGNTHVVTVSFFQPRRKWNYDFYHFVIPRCSPYAIFTYICDEFMVDGSKYSIDGAYVFFWKPVWFYHEIGVNPAQNA